MRKSVRILHNWSIYVAYAMAVVFACWSFNWEASEFKLEYYFFLGDLLETTVLLLMKIIDFSKTEISSSNSLNTARHSLQLKLCLLDSSV